MKVYTRPERWLATVLATDELLANLSFKKPGSYRERGKLLRELEGKYSEVAKLGIMDRFSRGINVNPSGMLEVL